MALTQTNSPTRAGPKSDVSIPGSTNSAIVFGHADGDGHLAAVQTSEWLARREVEVATVVSPATRNYLFWGRLPKFNLSSYQLIVFIDIAFRFSDPNDSLTRLLNVSDKQPDKQFVAIDHHPLIGPESPRENITLIEVTDPYDCCLGMPDPELMQVAALCDGSPTSVNPTPQLIRRALGVKRAAADVGGVAGDVLLSLITARQWDFFEALADEDKDMHRSARGIRRRSSETSPLLEHARSLEPLQRTR